MSCRSQKAPTTQPINSNDSVHIEIREVIRDSIITIPADSAWLTALLECDSTGKVLMRQFEKQDGENAKLKRLLLQYNEDIGLTELRLSFYVDSLQREINIRDRIIKKYKAQNKEYLRYIDKPYPTWIKVMVAFGVLFILEILLFIVAFIIRLAK